MSPHVKPESRTSHRRRHRRVSRSLTANALLEHERDSLKFYSWLTGVVPVTTHHRWWRRRRRLELAGSPVPRQL